MWYIMVAGTLVGGIYGLVHVNNPLMWVKHVINHPANHNFCRWYVYHSQMGGLFLFYPH